MSPSEYDPIRVSAPNQEDDLEDARDLFAVAAGPFLASPWSWLAWSLILPAAAFGTPRLLASTGYVGVLFLWSAAVLLGGAVEIGAARRSQRSHSASSSLARWVLRSQGNLSMVGVALSIAAIWQGAAWLLPGIWLLLLGHSLWSLGGMAFPPLKSTGLLYQIGGVLALYPGGEPLLMLAVATAVGNLWAAWSIWRRTSSESTRM